MPWLINASQLDKFRKSQKSLIILDASWHLPDEARDAKQEFLNKHIIDAKFFDIDDFSDKSPDAAHPHMLIRDEAVINEKLSALGIRNDFKIIIYDNSKLHSACRAAWMFKVFGHNPQQLYVLDGGLGAWDQYGGKAESGESVPSPKQYKINWQEKYIRTLADMKKNDSEQVVDVRHAVRYAGGPEIRPGLRPGHIPGSLSFPYTSLFEKNDCFRPLDKLRALLSGVNIDLNAPIISMCGSGITAATLDFALDLLEHPQHSIYNGSWSEWGAERLFAGETSLDERPVIRSLDIEI